MDEWRSRAACQRVDPELFWPDDRAGTPGLALHTCQVHCPVLIQCRQWTTDNVCSGMVSAGVHWVTKHGSGGKQLCPSRRSMPSPSGCPICAGLS